MKTLYTALYDYTGSSVSFKNRMDNLDKITLSYVKLIEDNMVKIKKGKYFHAHKGKVFDYNKKHWLSVSKTKKGALKSLGSSKSKDHIVIEVVINEDILGIDLQDYYKNYKCHYEDEEEIILQKDLDIKNKNST
jgi:hypothetical protein